LQVKERADERTRTTELLIASEKWEVAGHCGHLLWLAESSYLSEIFFTGLLTIAQHCAALRSIAQHCAALRSIARWVM
jgi:hypothetical protein